MSEKELVRKLFESEAVQNRLEYIDILARRSARYAPQVAQVHDEMCTMENLEQALRVLHQVQRLDDIAALDMDDNDAVFEALQDNINFPLWDSFATFDVSDDDATGFARRMYEGDPELQHPIGLFIADYARGVSEKVLHHILQQGDAVDVLVMDEPFKRRLMCQLDVQQANAYGDHVSRYYLAAKRRIQILSNNPSVEFVDPVPDKEVYTNYTTRLQGLRNTYCAEQFFTLTKLPTPTEAMLDGMEYGAYKKLFMDAVNVDQEQQERANKILIAKLNAASMVHITNSDGTDLTLSIKGQSFANSLSRKNVPGSEVFSSPLIKSANGRIVAKGRFMPLASDQIVEDITLDIEDGVIATYDAAKGREYLAQIIETDEGSKRLGEFAVGTNPVLRYHSVNSLLVEKIGGSFHVAIGAAYQITDYMGEKVKLDNGNRSAVHWDITTMLHNKDGMIALDGVPIMQRGRYLDPELQFLNGPSITT